ncbi:MAG: hypothetical protein JW797_08570 [Bradymonadales bacterium]|nr:hypothetical protein [Bradymonadales bacterium]
MKPLVQLLVLSLSLSVASTGSGKEKPWGPAVTESDAGQVQSADDTPRQESGEPSGYPAEESGEGYGLEHQIESLLVSDKEELHSHPAEESGIDLEDPGVELTLARTTDYRRIPFAMALLTPIDSNSIEVDHPVLNHFAFNWLYGESDRVEGFQVSLFGQRTVDRLHGLQLAGAFDVVGADLDGFQAAGALNHIGGDLDGLQLAGGWNHVSDSAVGFQGAGAVNTVLGDLTGVQVAGGVNYSPRLTGVQAAPINVAGNLTGAQIGTVNVTSGRVEGAQVGLLNYAEEADFSIGLVGATRVGGIHPVAWTSDTALINTGLRGDANYTYTTLSAGMYPLGEDLVWLLGAGLGVKFPRFVADFGLELDISHHAVMFEHDFENGYTSLTIARLLARWDLLPGFSVYGGPAINLYVGQGENRLRERPGYIPSIGSYELEEHEVSAEAWPGFSLGINLL